MIPLTEDSQHMTHFSAYESF